MKKYFCFFQNRFQTELQYRGASVTGTLTQFLWGLMECLAFRALLESNAVTSPMSLQAVISYVWLREAFFLMLNTWAMDNDIMEMLTSGGIAYEMCRPVSIYDMWYARTIGGRIASALLRCTPILLLAFCLPGSCRMRLPANGGALVMFALTMLLACAVTVSFCMFVYILAFFTVSPEGVRKIMMGLVDFLAGSVIPLPFIPQPLRSILELLPFGSMQNVPLRIYSGDLVGTEMWNALWLQIFWLVFLIFLGKTICRAAERRVVIQGG